MKNYRWVVVGACFTLLFVGFSAAYSFGAFFSAFEAEFGAPRGDVALVFSAAAFIWFMLGAPGGMLADRYGPRRMALAGVASLAAAMVLASFAQSVHALYLTYSIGVGLGLGLVYVPAVGAVQPWFTANRAAASGIAISGIGAGNVAGPWLAAWAIERFGWRGGYLALALMVVALGVAAAVLIRRKPAAAGRAADSGASLREALGTRSFWLLYAAGLLSGVGILVPIVHLGPYALDLGFTQGQAVTLVSLIGLGSLLGRFAVGPFADRFGRRVSLAAMYASLGAMYLLWWGASAYWALLVFAAAYGVFYGGSVSLVPPLVMDVYGARAVSGIIGFLFTAAGIGTLLGPWAAGLAYDLWGGYEVPLLAMGVLQLCAAACIVALIRDDKGRPARPVETRRA